MAKDKKMKKEKATAAMEVDQDNDEDSVKFLSPIAHPLAEKKLSKKLFKTVKKGNKIEIIEFDIILKSGLENEIYSLIYMNGLFFSLL